MTECNKITKIQRRYPDSKWDYKGLSCRTTKNGKPTDIIYYTLKNRGKSTKGVEVYSGKNYIVGSNAPSYSRRFNIKNIPSDIKPVVNSLQVKYNKSKWSNKIYINQN